MSAHDHLATADAPSSCGGTSHASPPATTRVKDPVCGMSVDPAIAKHKHTHDGVPYYFCAARCREKFIAEPTRYLAPQAAQPTATTTVPGAIYTCPMHLEVRHNGPGACPICGMALEPEEITADTGPSAELVDMTRRFWFALALAAPVFVMEMAGQFF